MNQNREYRKAYIFIVLHALFVIIWNVVGILLIANGKQALGPTATWTGVGLFSVLIIIYTIFYKNADNKLFTLFVTIGALLGSYAIYGAFTKDHSLWPSEFWRYAGIAVNLLGIIGFILSLKALGKK